jgi:hypothetical protein
LSEHTAGILIELGFSNDEITSFREQRMI